MLGIRIFGILVNSMPDERTNSNITWFNSALRGNQKQEGLLDMIMVGTDIMLRYVYDSSHITREWTDNGFRVRKVRAALHVVQRLHSVALTSP